MLIHQADLEEKEDVERKSNKSRTTSASSHIADNRIMKNKVICV